MTDLNMDITRHTRNQQVIDEYICFFNNLEQSLDDETLEQLTAETFRFIDPFNDVTGHQAARKVLTHFIDHVGSPYFKIKQISWADNVCFLRWDFEGRLPKGNYWRFPGVSEIHINEDAKITLHQDHWDASQHFYQRLPIVGSIIRWIQKRIKI